jgi:hypothetical protein
MLVIPVPVACFAVLVHASKAPKRVLLCCYLCPYMWLVFINQIIAWICQLLPLLAPCARSVDACVFVSEVDCPLLVLCVSGLVSVPFLPYALCGF